MSIFGRDEQPTAAPPVEHPTTPRPSQPKVARQVTQISEGTRIEGEISGATEVQVAGTVDGRIHVDSTVRIEAKGQINGEVQAKSVSVAGKVIGNIVGGDKVDIESSGKLQGDVKAPRVSIADGAYFKGRVEMTGQTPTKAAAPKPATTKPPPTKPAPSAQPKLGSVPLRDSGQ